MVILILNRESFDELMFKTERGHENNCCSQNDANSRQEMDGKKDRGSLDRGQMSDEIPDQPCLNVCCRKFVPAYCIKLQRILTSSPCSLTPTVSSFNTPLLSGRGKNVLRFQSCATEKHSPFVNLDPGDATAIHNQ